ncbi:hypothetical protein GT037_001854, partial [Alternaria burnsii]
SCMAWSPAKFIALAVTLTMLSIISVALRFWAHTKSRNKVGIDDVLIIPALLCVVGMAATIIVGTELGEMAQHQTNVVGPDGPVYTAQLRVYEQANYTLQLLAAISLGLTKCSVLCFYRRVFYVYPRFLFINNILMIVMAAWMISFFFAMVFQCRNPRILWTTFEYAPIRQVKCFDTLRFYYSVSISGFITDIVILASPLPVIYQLQMRWKTRIAAACILLLGVVVCGAGVMQIIQFVTIGRGMMAKMNDLTYFTTPVFAWSMVESSLAVTGANLPLLRPLLHRIERICSRLGSLFGFVESKHPASDYMETENSEVEAETKIEEVAAQREDSIRSYLSLELPPRREGALRPEDLLQIPPRALMEKLTASQATSHSSWTSEEWEDI